MKQSRCVVCRLPIEKKLALCKACSRSYDRSRAKDATTNALIRWAAERAWKFAQDETWPLGNSFWRMVKKQQRQR